MIKAEAKEQSVLVYTDEDDRIMIGRMINWGNVMRDRRTGHGYPTKVAWMQFPYNSGTQDELDADAIEEVLAAFRVSSVGLAKLHAFVLKVEYLEKPEGRMNTVAERAEDVRKRYRAPCSERTYYRLLWAARRAVWALL